jgi:hypothetical protein
MTEPIPNTAFPMAQDGHALVSVVVAQPLASAIVAFFLLYALLTVFLRLADWAEPPLRRPCRPTPTPPPKLWRFR